MMTVAAIIEQAQNRWMDHSLVYNSRSLQFQGSYCKYYFLYYQLSFFEGLFNYDVHHVMVFIGFLSNRCGMSRCL
jgi:hypothetical protein